MAALVLAASAGACDPADLVGAEELGLEVPCGTCGGNARVADVPFHDVDGNPDPIARMYNDDGLRFERFFDTRTAEELTLEIDVDNLVGITALGLRLEEEALIGTELIFSRAPVPNVTEIYHLEILGFGWQTFLVDGDERKVPSYDFWYYLEPPLGPDPPKLERLCQEVDDGAGDISGTAILFKGDRYDLHARSVRETSLADTWFNIACHGTALAKMHRIRHTLAGSTAARMTKESERQSYLKMFTADYCGTDYQFTMNGYPLIYRDRLRFLTDDRPPASFEAIWTEDGPLCLDTPRLHSYEEILVIEPDCHLPPPCTPEQIASPFEHGHVFSQNVERPISGRPPGL